MIQLSDEQLRQVQLVELDMLKEAHRICEKHELPYVIIAGTLLGAVRHRGFIPWDDDVDIALLREDYERFRKAAAEELDPEKYVFQDDRNTRGYRWGYGKIRRVGSLFVREHQEHMPYFQGIFIDVFPIDEVPVSRFGRVIVNARCFVIRKLLWAKAGKKAAGSRLMRAVYTALDLIPEKKCRRAYHRMIRRSVRLTRINDEKYGPDSPKRMARILMFPTPNRAYGYRRGWYAHRARYTFEDGEFYGIRDADDYLSFKFGDYRAFPSESERKTHPVSRLAIPEDMREQEEGQQ